MEFQNSWSFSLNCCLGRCLERRRILEKMANWVVYLRQCKVQFHRQRAAVGGAFFHPQEVIIGVVAVGDRLTEGVDPLCQAIYRIVNDLFNELRPL